MLYVVKITYYLRLQHMKRHIKHNVVFVACFILFLQKWKDLVEVKIHYYTCLCYLYRGLHSEEQSKFGERITFYKAGMEKLTEAMKLLHVFDKSDSAVSLLMIIYTLYVRVYIIAIKLYENSS